MTSEESTYQGPPASDLVKAIAALMRECLEKVRQHDPPETWQDVYSRIEALHARLDYQPMADNQPAHGTVCTYCGAARQMVSLHVFELCTPASRWHLCDRCWRLLAIMGSTRCGASSRRMAMMEASGRFFQYLFGISASIASVQAVAGFIEPGGKTYDARTHSQSVHDYPLE